MRGWAKRRRLTRFPSTSAVVLAMGLSPGILLALPAGGQVVSGQAKIRQSGTTMTVNQGSSSAILDGQS